MTMPLSQILQKMERWRACHSPVLLTWVSPGVSCGSMLGSRRNHKLSLPCQQLARDVAQPRCLSSRPAAQSRAMGLFPGVPRYGAELPTDGATLSAAE